MSHAVKGQYRAHFRASSRFPAPPLSVVSALSAILKRYAVLWRKKWGFFGTRTFSSGTSALKGEIFFSVLFICYGLGLQMAATTVLGPIFLTKMLKYRVAVFWRYFSVYKSPLRSESTCWWAIRRSLLLPALACACAAATASTCERETRSQH